MTLASEPVSVWRSNFHPRISVGSILLLAALLSVPLGGCSKSSKKAAPTATIPPDNPVPPVVSTTTDFTTDHQTIYVSSPSEDVVVSALAFGIWGCGGGGWEPGTDIVGGTTITTGGTLAVHVTPSLTWSSCVLYYVRVWVHRPGQSKVFMLELHHD